jgi:uncharacterized membrane protein
LIPFLREISRANQDNKKGMKSRLSKSWGLPPTWYRFLIVILLLLGVFFRFANLDRKAYWHDEVYTSLRISGYTEAELIHQVVNGVEIGVEDLQKYQRINPEKGLVDTIKGLAQEEPQIPPLYYVMARFWVQWFGDSVAVTRSLSALISLLVFPCLYWLCLELFESSLTGWVAIALMTVSPFHVLYAQEARHYSLWTVTILLSSAALLRAMRLKTKLSWTMYAATVAVGLYSFLFSGLVAISHGIYVVATDSEAYTIPYENTSGERDASSFGTASRTLRASLPASRFRFTKRLVAFMLAFLAGFLAFVPWVLVVISNLSAAEKTTAWMTRKLPLMEILKSWYRALSIIFIDFWSINDFFPNLHLPNLSFGKYLGLPLMILIGYSIYFLYRNAPQRAWLFIFSLIGVTALALILPDLIFGGRRSYTYRYLVPCYLGVQLAVSHLFANKIIAFSSNIWRQKLWQLIMITLVSGGVLSCAISSQAEGWWNKYSEASNSQTAHIINQATHPLLISDSEIGYVMSLNHLLDSKVRLQLFPKLRGIESKLLNIPDGFSDMFLFESQGSFKVLRTPSNPLRYELAKEQNYQIKPVYERGGLWRIEKNLKIQGAGL